MESMKEKITSWLKYFKDYINSFRFVEKEKNIFYFSKFSLDISEFFLIHEFVKTLKENIFKKNIEQFKYCVKNIILFNEDNNKKLNEKEKIIILYSACLFIYYKKFRFNTNCSFENYFDEEFVNISKTIFKFEIKNNNLFKIFFFFFFSIMKEQILALDYSKIRSIKKYYNYLKGENINEEEDNEIANNNGSSQKEKEGFQEQVLTFLISAKEKMVDLVFETNKNQNSEKNIENIFQSGMNNLNFYLNYDNNEKNENNKKYSNNNLNIINNNSEYSDNKSDMTIDDCSPQKPKAFNANNNSMHYMSNSRNNINSINSINNMNIHDSNSIMLTDYSNNNINNINDNSFNTTTNNIINNNNNNSINFNNTQYNFNYPNLNLSNSNTQFNSLETINSSGKDINSNRSNIYSKRVISELIKSEFDDKTMEIIEEVSKIIDEKYLDNFLNSTSKTVTMIQYFCCYIVEFTPDMLQNICPQYKDTLENFAIKFIVLAKELYNTAMEIFSTIYDLNYTNFDTFMDLTKDCGIPMEHAQGLYKIFRDYSITLLNEKKKKGVHNNIMNVLRKLFDQENQKWGNIIKQKSNEFTNFYKV